MSHASPLIRRLQRFCPLPEADKAELQQLAFNARRIRGRCEIGFSRGGAAALGVVLEGLAYRREVLSDGRRQITSYYVPGDIYEARFSTAEPDNSVTTVEAAKLLILNRDKVFGFFDTHPAIARALWYSASVDQAIAREQMVCVGRRSSLERVAHFLSEFFARLQSVGLTSATSCKFPLTQTELGDFLGLSTVHVNRMLQKLRRENLLSLKNRKLTVFDMQGLHAVAMFDPGYLRLHGESSSRSRPSAVPAVDRMSVPTLASGWRSALHSG